MSALDSIIIGLILLSGVFAMTRGLVRELFSIASWAFAAVVTYFLYPPLEGLGVSVFSFLPAIGPQLATGIVIFTFVLLSASFVTIKLTEKLRGKEPGKFDGTAGFLFGLVRGYVLACLLALIVTKLWLPSEAPAWVSKSALLPTINKTNEALLSALQKAEQKLPEELTPAPSPSDELGKLIEDNNY